MPPIEPNQPVPGTVPIQPAPGTVASLLRAVVDSIDGGVVIFDAQGNLAYANPGGQEQLEQLAASGGSGRSLIETLTELGARVVPLRNGRRQLGEAVYLNPPSADGTLAVRERQVIMDTLESTGWRLSRAARSLGISRTTLWRRLKAYGVRRDARP